MNNQIKTTNFHVKVPPMQQRTHSFYIRTSNFGAEAERSYCFWQFEPGMFLRCS